MTDDRDLDDPALAAAWRAQSPETPSPALDAAILAAAHRAAKSAPEKISPVAAATQPWRWWAPLVAAATIGVIAIGALQLIPQEHDAATAVVSDMPAGAPAAPVDALKAQKREEARDNASATSPPAVAPSPPAAQPPVEARARQQAPSTRSAVSAEQSSPKQPTPASPQPFPARQDAAVPAKPSADRAEAAAGAPAPAPAAERFASGKVAAQAPAPEQDASPGPPPAALAAAPTMAKRALRDDSPASTPRTPDEWIARIRKWVVDGDMAEANRALKGFRAAYGDADARLPADLRLWAATVPR